MSELTLKIDGLRELRDAMIQLPQNIGRNVLRGGVNAASEIVRKDAQTKAKKGPTGRLRAAIYKKQIAEESGPQRQTFFVGVRAGKRYRNVKRGKKTVNLDAYYWWFVENGTKFKAARPFLRPAFDQNVHKSVFRMRDYIADRLPQEAAKLAKR